MTLNKDDDGSNFYTVMSYSPKKEVGKNVTMLNIKLSIWHKINDYFWSRNFSI